MDIDNSSAIIFVSFVKLDFFLFLKILTKFSACLTDNFFSIILLATNKALSRPTKILAWPVEIFLLSISSRTLRGKFNIRNEFVI